MPTQTTVESNVLTLNDLKEMAATTGPCITVLLPLHPEDKRQNPARLKGAVDKLQRNLSEWGFDREAIQELVRPISEISLDYERGTGALAIFRSIEGFRVFRLAKMIEEHVSVGENFYIRPLLTEIADDKVFYILALSQKDIRLLRCTDTSSEEVPLPDSVPKSVDERMQTDTPDHNLNNMQAVGQSTGSMKGVISSTSTDREDKDEYLRIFYRSVARGMQDILRNERRPLVIAGVDYEIPIYRDVNEYEHLIEEAVKGAPNGLKGGELHKRALEIVQPYFDQTLPRALNQFEKQGGTDRTSTGLKDIVKAAHEARVAHLFIADSARPVMGRFDEATHKVRTNSAPQLGEEDLINAAIAQTLVFGGQVHILPQSQMPQNSVQAAVLRY
jgi:hypothetical protein